MEMDNKEIHSRSSLNSIKLAILGTRGIPARYGGFETFAEELGTRLAASGVDVTVYCQTTLTKADETYRGVTLKYVKLPGFGPFDQLLWDAKCFFLVGGKFDVVYMLGYGAAFSAWVPRLAGSCVWVNTDGIEWRRAKWGFLQKLYLLASEAMAVWFSSRLIADSKAIENYLQTKYRGLNHITTIPYGAYPLMEQPSPTSLIEFDLQAGGYYIVVCRLEPENHLLEMIKGYKASTSTLPLVILGDIRNPNPYVQELLAHRCDRIRYVGTVYEQEKLVALRYFSKGYFHGHSVGGTNPSLLEAMACSNVVIAHDNPFNREVLGNAGLFFKTSEDLASITNDIESSKIDIHPLRKLAFDRICSHYRWESISAAYETLLGSTL